MLHKDPIRLVLASASPRRAQLLQQIGIDCVVVPADIDESKRVDETAQQYVMRLALDKARTVWDSARHPAGLPVLAADTAVVLDEEVLGKPNDEADAMSIWSKLSGKAHRVMTGVCLKTADEELLHVEITQVWMREVARHEWHDYWLSGEPRDKAGAYAIQGLAARFITRIDGSYTNVVGLPLHVVDALLRRVSFSRHSAIPT